MGEWQEATRFWLHFKDKGLMGFADGLEMECKRRKEVRDDIEIFIPSNCKNKIAIYNVGRPWEKHILEAGVGICSLDGGMLDLSCLLDIQVFIK